LSQDQFFQDQLKPLMQQWSQIENYRRNLETQVQRQAESAQLKAQEAARTPALDPKDAQKLAFGQHEMRFREQEHQQKIRHKEQDHEIDLKKESVKLLKETTGAPST
jgi:hypothetical protein